MADGRNVKPTAGFWTVSYILILVLQCNHMSGGRLSEADERRDGCSLARSDVIICLIISRSGRYGSQFLPSKRWNMHYLYIKVEFLTYFMTLMENLTKHIIILTHLSNLLTYVDLLSHTVESSSRKVWLHHIVMHYLKIWNHFTIMTQYLILFTWYLRFVTILSQNIFYLSCILTFWIIFSYTLSLIWVSSNVIIIVLKKYSFD